MGQTIPASKHLGKWIGGFALIALAVGCRPAAYDSITVHGSVSVDGNALETGAVRFVPMDEEMGPAVGSVVKDGQFRVDNVPLGRHCVVFSAVRKGRELPPTHNLPRWETINLISADKRAGIIVEVTQSSSNLNFDL